MSIPRERDAAGRFVKSRTNGDTEVDARSTMTLPVGLGRIIRPQAAYRWLAPGIAAFTPAYIQMILNGALAGDHVAQWQLFDMMLDTWPTLSSCVQEMVYGVTRRTVVFDPYAEEDSKATREAEEKEKVVAAAFQNWRPDATRDDNTLNATLASLMDAWFRGISVLEIIWDLIESKKLGTIWGPVGTVWCHPSTYGFNSEGQIGLTIQQPYGYGATSQTGPLPFQGIKPFPYNKTIGPLPGGYGSTSVPNPMQQPLQTFPPNKFLIGVHKVRSGTLFAGAMLRPLAWWWCASNFTADWLLNLAQVFGIPFRWATYIGTSPDQTVQAICDMLQNMGTAGWAAFPEGTKLELKEPHTGTTGHTPQGDLLDRADHYARMMILGQTMTGATLASGRGGQAFGTVEAQLKQDRLDAACAYVAGVFNLQLIPAILRLNYGDESEPPTCRFLQESEGTYQDSERDQILCNIGVQIPISHLQRKYNIPDATGTEPVSHPSAKALPGGAGATAGPPGTRPIEQAHPAANKAQTPTQVQTRLEQISAITDDETFGRELRKFASELTTGETHE